MELKFNKKRKKKKEKKKREEKKRKRKRKEEKNLHLQGYTRQFTINIHCTLQLKKIPVLLDSPNNESKTIKRKHKKT